MKHLIVIMLCSIFLHVNAQNTTDWQESLRQWMTTEDMEESFGQEAMEMLEERAATPFNLNQVTREQLEELPFLTAKQVEGIIEYVDRYGPVRSLSELQMITALDYDTRQVLQWFVYIGEEKAKRIWPTWTDLAKNGKHTLMATAKIPFYNREGDSRNDSKSYVGYKYRHDIRYQYNFHSRIKFGLTAAQDAGEPLFSYNNKMGYDHYAYYLQLRDMGRLQELNLGMYRVQMGMGLVMNTGFHLGKLATLQSMGRSTHLLTAHSSRSAANYMQGAAATVKLSPHWKATAFASYRYLDATLNDDGSARTLLDDGYHRTLTELSKKNNTQRTDFGATIGWHPSVKKGDSKSVQKGALFLNLNMVYTHLNRTLKPQKENTPYRRYAAEGNDFFNISIDYGYTNYRLSVNGETAMNRNGALALIHTVNYRLSETLSLMALHRYYDKRYTSLHAHSFGEGSGTQNEHGIYLGASWKPNRKWMLQGYADYAHFSWLRYQVSNSSDALDGMLSSRYNHGRWTVEGRYRLHLRQRDDKEKKMICNQWEHRARLAVGCDITPQLSLRTQADGACVQTQKSNTRGIMLSQHVSWKWHSIKVDGHASWFHTDDYSTRLYQNERSVLYDFSFPAYYGHGVHYSLMAGADIGRHLTCTAKVNITDYFDRSTIGSSLQQINHSSMTDLLIQLRYKF